MSHLAKETICYYTICIQDRYAYPERYQREWEIARAIRVNRSSFLVCETGIKVNKECLEEHEIDFQVSQLLKMIVFRVYKQCPADQWLHISLLPICRVNKKSCFTATFFTDNYMQVFPMQRWHVTSIHIDGLA